MYTRCAYVSDDNGIQCETWFRLPDNYEVLPPEERHAADFCPRHQGSCNVRMAANGVAKETFLQAQNQQRIFCHAMTLNQLDDHIEKLTQLIEQERMKINTAKAVRVEKEEELNEGERKERRKNNLTRNVLKAQSEQRQTEERKASLKKDPVEHMMQKFNLPRHLAEIMVHGAKK